MRLFLFGDVVVRCGSVPVNDAKTPHETKLSSRKSPPPPPGTSLWGMLRGRA